MPKERGFRTLKEVKDTFFPNIPMEELLRKPSDEEIREELKKIIKRARKNTERISSKKVPR